MVGFIAGLCICLLVSFSGVAQPVAGDTERADVADADTPEVPKAVARIQRQIDTVSSESLSESMSNLYRVNMFTWPGGGPRQGRGIEGSLLPLYPAAGGRDLHQIASNRRFLRILQDLSTMDKAAAARLLNDHLARSLELHDSLFSQYTSEIRPLFRTDSDYVQPNQHGAIPGPGWIGHTVDEKKPVVLGAKYGVLSLVWLAGHVGATESHEMIKGIVEAAVDLRDSLYSDGEVIEYYRYGVLEGISVYNRQILAFGLTRTSPRASELEQMLRDKDVVEMRLELPHFDALLTPYDFPVTRFWGPPDMSKGILELQYYGPIDDQTFDALVREAIGAPD